MTRQLAHEPLGWRPTTLIVTIRRYRCIGCGHVWRQDTSLAAQARAKLSRRRLRWALEGIVVQHLTVARVADGLGVAWNTAAARPPWSQEDPLHRARRTLHTGAGLLTDKINRLDALFAVDEHVEVEVTSWIY